MSSMNLNRLGPKHLAALLALNDVSLPEGVPAEQQDRTYMSPI